MVDRAMAQQYSMVDVTIVEAWVLHQSQESRERLAISVPAIG